MVSNWFTHSFLSWWQFHPSVLYRNHAYLLEKSEVILNTFFHTEYLINWKIDWFFLHITYSTSLVSPCLLCLEKPLFLLWILVAANSLANCFYICIHIICSQNSRGFIFEIHVWSHHYPQNPALLASPPTYQASPSLLIAPLSAWRLYQKTVNLAKSFSFFKSLFKFHILCKSILTMLFQH